MNEKLTPFQAIIFGILVLAIIVGVTMFSLRKQSETNKAVPISMWGTLSAEVVNEFQDRINNIERDSVAITYTQFSEETFEQELIEALASGKSPDAVIFSDDLLVDHENKLFLIGYDFFPQRDFKETFIEAGEILLREQGIIGIPFTIDPMVAYWNRSTLNNNGISQPPVYWDEFLQIVPKLSEIDSSNNIKKSTIALGEYRNIKNVKSIFATLVNQAGNPIFTRNKDGFYGSIFDERLGYKIAPADAALTFFTQFSNPTKDVYTWNRGLPKSDEMFLSGDLAFYLGFASERKNLLAKNPNLNFDVSIVPQSRSNINNERVVIGDMYFLGILNRSENIGAAYQTFIKMIETQNMQYLSEITGLPSVRRDLLVDVPSSSYQDVFNDSALIAETFIDPEYSETDKIFQEMIESVISGRQTVTESIRQAGNKLDQLFN
jgi:ABC-type glycerol-3-phosphate transport system substrate-binding protein